MKAKRVVKKDKVIQKEEKITVPPLETRKATITLEGMSPLLVHKFSTKAKRQIEDKQQKKAKPAREARNPQKEYEESMYYIKRGKKPIYGIPLSGIKNAAVSATKFIEGVFATTARGAFHVIDENGSGLIPIQSKGGPQFDERIVRLMGVGKPADIRYRGRFDDWKVTFKIIYNSRIISLAQISNLFENAGFSIGLHELRPEKNGSLGMFSVKRA